MRRQILKFYRYGILKFSRNSGLQNFKIPRHEILKFAPQIWRRDFKIILLLQSCHRKFSLRAVKFQNFKIPAKGKI